MSRKEKLTRRLKNLPKDFTYSELISIFNMCGFIEDTKGKTAGSRVKFYNSEKDIGNLLHKTHPGNIVKGKALKDAVEFLTTNNLI